MAKSFKGGLDSLLGGKTTAKKKSRTTRAEVVEKRKAGRPRSSTKIPKDTTEEGTKEGEKRATFIVREDLLETVSYTHLTLPTSDLV